VTKTIFARSSGDRDKKSRQEALDEKRRINNRCMELRLKANTTKEAVTQAKREGIKNRVGAAMTPAALMYRCQWALIDNPDRWREQIDNYDRPANKPPMTDDEWDQHVVEVGIEFARHSAGHVFKLFRSDPARWGKWAHLWENNSDFATFFLPTLVGQRQERSKLVI
jgi:hypothetical protein